ncbi:MAG: hypothetical protein WA432_03060 [Candidatus Babeliaceae bacterium]
MKRLMILSLALTLGSASVVNAVETAKQQPGTKELAHFYTRKFLNGMTLPGEIATIPAAITSMLLGSLGSIAAKTVTIPANRISNTLFRRPIFLPVEEMKIGAPGSLMLASLAGISYFAPTLGAAVFTHLIINNIPYYVEIKNHALLEETYPKSTLAVQGLGAAAGVGIIYGSTKLLPAVKAVGKIAYSYFTGN